MPYRILMLSSVPLSAPWNGGDKNLARLVVESDLVNSYTVQTGEVDQWPAGRVTSIRLHGMRSMPTTAQKLRAFMYVVRHTAQVDMVHVVASVGRPWRWTGGVLRTWSNLTRKPLIHTVPSAGDRPVKRRDFPGDVTVVLSEHTRRMLEDVGVPNVVRIYPPVDVSRLRGAAARAGVAVDLALGQRAILYPVHFGPDSGIKEMILAFARLPEELNDSVLVLACRAHAWQNAQHETRQVLEWVRQAGVAQRVRVESHVADMPALIAACAVTALVPAKLGSKMDLPMAILESLALSRPVIVADRPPMNEALLGDGGMMVSYGDIAGLTAALARLLADQDLRRRLGAQGHDAVLRLCDPMLAVERYQQIYDAAASMQRVAVEATGR